MGFVPPKPKWALGFVPRVLTRAVTLFLQEYDYLGAVLFIGVGATPYLPFQPLLHIGLTV